MTALTSSGTATYLDDFTVYTVPSPGSFVVNGSGANTTVTVTVTLPTGATSTDFQVGEEVTIAGTTNGTGINGTFAITAVSGATFTYASPNAVAPTVQGVTTATGFNANNTVYLPTATTDHHTASWNATRRGDLHRFPPLSGDWAHQRCGPSSRSSRLPKRERGRRHVT